MLAELPPAPPDAAAAVDTQRIRVAIAGRPNVGKSTLVNRLLGEERVLAYDEPGTTRDSIYIDFERDGEPYTLIDTAGLRRRSRVDDKLEKFSIVKTLQAIDNAHVVVMVLDARTGIVEHDATLLGLAVERGRALVIAVNKWDGLDSDARDAVKNELSLKLPFLDFARVHFISALHGSGVGELFVSVREAWTAANSDLSTPILTRTLERAVQQHQPGPAGVQDGRVLAATIPGVQTLEQISDNHYKLSITAGVASIKGTYDGGEEFFHRLDGLRANPGLHAEVLEVYYLCMALGFKGKYQLHGQEELRELIEGTYAEVAKQPGLKAGRLAPHGAPRDTVVTEVRGRVPTWVLVAAALVLGLVVYLGMSVYISRTADAVAEDIELVTSDG